MADLPMEVPKTMGVLSEVGVVSRGWLCEAQYRLTWPAVTP